MSDPSEGLRRLLRRHADDRSWCTGYQITVSINGDTVLNDGYGIDGLEQPVTPDSLFTVYCAGKPFTSVAIGTLVDDDELSFHDRLGNIIDGELHPALAALTVEQVLTHTAGLWRYPATAFMLVNPTDREQAVRHLEPAEQPPGAGVYADFAGWELLRLAIEALTGEPFEQYIARRVLTPLGLSDRVFYTLDPTGEPYTRYRLNVDLQTGRPMPMLWERSPYTLSDGRAHSCITSTAALVDFYTALARQLRGDDSAGVIRRATLHDMLTKRTAPGFDPVLRRHCQHGTGFMVNLVDHAFGSAFSEHSFGHSGMNGMTFAGVDPATGLAFAVHLNGVTHHDHPTDPARSPQARRTLIGDHVTAIVDSATR